MGTSAVRMVAFVLLAVLVALSGAGLLDGGGL